MGEERLISLLVTRNRKTGRFKRLLRLAQLEPKKAFSFTQNLSFIHSWCNSTQGQTHRLKLGTDTTRLCVFSFQLQNCWPSKAITSEAKITTGTLLLCVLASSNFTLFPQPFAAEEKFGGA